MRYFLVAGESSGDQHAADLMVRLKEADPYAVFSFIGGDRMSEIGGEPLIPIRELAFMGFTQVIGRLGLIRKSFNLCHEEIIRFKPDIIIPVDYGGFNLRLIRWAAKKGFRSIYYITPKVWAWMPSRARILAKYTDKTLCILPFESAFLEKYGSSSVYVGNPVRDSVRPVCERNVAELKSELGLGEKPVIAILPGSRDQEIRKILPKMISMVPEFPDYHFVVAACDPFSDSYYGSLIKDSGVSIVRNHTHELLRIANAALVTSGTATLEAGLLGTPQVVCYRTSPFSYLIARMLVRIRYISLVNLILNRNCVEELIQGRFNRRSLRVALKRIVSDEEVRNEMRTGYQEMTKRLGDSVAAREAAGIISSLAVSG
ncbi:MAG: lipid-A-disaccharide synthase [Bacteroidota bacterium]